MFNMYDDEGIKVQIDNPYEIKKLEAISSVKNQVNQKNDNDNDNLSHSKFKGMLNNEAKNSYKKMANIHLEEEIVHVYQLMHSNVIVVKYTDTIAQCWEEMEKYDLKQIPIVNSNMKIKGLATMKNITNALIKNINNPKYIYDTSIDTIAISNVITADPISDIRRVAKVMVQYDLNSIPIVEGTEDKVIGIISRADILKAVSSNPHYQLWA